jgi:hypothetical protein
MSEVGDIEKFTQDRVVQLFSKQLGYTYLGNWETRLNNSNIEEKCIVAGKFRNDLRVIWSKGQTLFLYFQV